MAPERVLEFYRQQSPLTCPGKYVYLYQALPEDVSALVEAVQNVLLYAHWVKAQGLELPEERYQEIYLRTVQEMLGRVQELQARPLTELRPPERRLVSLCRDFAVLLVLMLSH